MALTTGGGCRLRLRAMPRSADQLSMTQVIVCHTEGNTDVLSVAVLIVEAH